MADQEAHTINFTARNIIKLGLSNNYFLMVLIAANNFVIMH